MTYFIVYIDLLVNFEIVDIDGFYNQEDRDNAYDWSIKNMDMSSIAIRKFDRSY